MSYYRILCFFISSEIDSPELTDYYALRGLFSQDLVEIFNMEKQKFFFCNKLVALSGTCVNFTWVRFGWLMTQQPWGTECNGGLNWVFFFMFDSRLFECHLLRLCHFSSYSNETSIIRFGFWMLWFGTHQKLLVVPLEKREKLSFWKTTLFRKFGYKIWWKKPSVCSPGFHESNDTRIITVDQNHIKPQGFEITPL